MGLVKAASAALRGTLADQWKDFLTVPANVAPTAALFRAVHVGSATGRGANIRASHGVITNGSLIVVPEGYGLLLFQDGGLTGFVSEPGSYVWDSTNTQSQSVFLGNRAHASLWQQSWERFRFGGRPAAQQLALFVALKELPGNRFGTRTAVFWDDAYLNTQAGATAYGTYSIAVTDPILFVKQFVPATYLQAHAVFDFTDSTNPAAQQVFTEVVNSLSAAFSSYSNHADRGNRITRIQQDALGFARSLAQAVEDAYRWRSTRGLEIANVAIMGIDYDEQTKNLLATVQRADALTGARGDTNLKASIAAGLQAAGASGDGAGGILGLGIAASSIGLLSSMQQPAPSAGGHVVTAQPGEDLVAKLGALKRALDAGLISQADFDAAKSKAIGLT